MSKKAQGMSMNVIIIAALALLVLVILAVIFIGRMGTTTKGIDECKGTCIPQEECGDEPYEKQLGDPCFVAGTKDVDTSVVCCVKV